MIHLSSPRVARIITGRAPRESKQIHLVCDRQVDRLAGRCVATPNDAVIVATGASGIKVGNTHFTSMPTETSLWVMKSQLLARNVRPDSRNRVSLGRALDDLGDASFDIYRDEKGRIILDPRVSIPASEAWLFRNQKAIDSVRRGLSDAAGGKTKSAGSFAAYAEDDE